jgi:hypothetical protein
VQATDTSGKVLVAVTSTARPGLYYFRGYDASGATELIPFIVDQCGDLLEVEPNDHHAKAQLVESLPVSIHGCLEKSAEVDTYQVRLQQGQTLIASVDGQRFLNSPMDADLQVLTSTGVVLAQQLDHHGLDPEIIFVAPRNDLYLIRILAFPETPNSTIAYAGEDRFVYRLMMTSGPFLEITRPAVLSSTQPSELQLLGVNLQNQAPISLPAVNVENVKRLWFSQPGVQGLIELPISPAPAVIEAEPNELASPQIIAAPCVVTGTISTNKERDHFQFISQKDQRWKISVEAQSFGSPLDAVLTLSSTDGKQLATHDDAGEVRDPALSFVAPGEGPYLLTVHDMFQQGSSRHWYRLFVQPEAADFSLTTTTANFSGKVGQPLEITIEVQRQLEFAEDITVTLEQALPNGSRPEVISKKADESGKSVKLVLQSDQPIAAPIRIVGRVSSRPQVSLAKPSKANSDWLWLTIAP